MARLRARAHLAELRTSDLCFASEEAAVFLRDLMGLQLRGEHVAALAASTEGWAAGLQLTALAVRARHGQPDRATFVNAFDGSHRFVLDYLVEEVLTRQPKALQAFLLQTAVLNRLCGPLCDAVTERQDAAATLEGLERADLFLVPLDEDRYWYRYHHLFADALRAHVRPTEPTLVPRLFQRAAAWCAAAELSEEAVGYALAGHAFSDAAGQIERVARGMIQRGETAMLQKWLNALPADLVQRRPRLGLALVWSALARGQIEAVGPRVLAVEQARFQGYGLGLKGGGGLPVLRQLGLFDQLRPYMQPITNFIFCDQQGHALLQLLSGGDDKHQTLRVKRSRLREVLRSGAPQVKINFGLQCTGYEQAADSINVYFGNGLTVGADYVVATDGVGSALHQQMVGDRKRYLGLTSIVGQAPIKVEDSLLAGGYCLMLGTTGASAFCYREEDGTHLSYTEHVESEDSLAEQTPEQLLRRIQVATAAWHSPIPQIAAAIDSATIVVRGYYDKEPVKQVREGRLWLIGDAAHPMSPFQGQGANMAMLDALCLAELLPGLGAPHGGSNLEASKLEADIVARGRKAVTDSRSAARQFHTQSRFQQRNRNFGFRFANMFISRFSKQSHEALR